MGWVRAGVAMWVLLFFGASLSWIGLGAQACMDHMCGMTRESRILAMVSCMWFIGGFLLIRLTPMRTEMLKQQSLGHEVADETEADDEENDGIVTTTNENSIIASDIKGQNQVTNTYRSRIASLLDSIRTLEDEPAATGADSTHSTNSSIVSRDPTVANSVDAKSASPTKPLSVAKLPSKKPVRIERSSSPNGGEVVTTTRSSMRRDGTRVIEKNTVFVMPPVEQSGCAALVEDLCRMDSDDIDDIEYQMESEDYVIDSLEELPPPSVNDFLRNEELPPRTDSLRLTSVIPVFHQRQSDHPETKSDSHVVNNSKLSPSSQSPSSPIHNWPENEEFPKRELIPPTQDELGGLVVMGLAAPPHKKKGLWSSTKNRFSTKSIMEDLRAAEDQARKARVASL